MVRHVIFTACLTLAINASSSWAETVNVKYVGKGLGRNVQWTTNGGANWKTTFAGQLMHNLQGTVGGVTVDGDYTCFCTELGEYTNSNQNPFEVVELKDAPVPGTPMGPTKAQAIVDIYSQYGSQALATSGGGGTNDFSSAFQIAIWEIAYDYDGTAPSLNITGGNFEARSTNSSPLYANVAANVATIFGAVGLNASMPGLYALVNDGIQDEIVIVPLPTTLMLGTAGLGLIWLRRRK